MSILVFQPTGEAASTPESRGLRRDEVRMLVASPDAITHAQVRDLPDHLAPGDLLVVNTSATLPAAVTLPDGRTAISNWEKRRSSPGSSGEPWSGAIQYSPFCRTFSRQFSWMNVQLSPLCPASSSCSARALWGSTIFPLSTAIFGGERRRQTMRW